MATGKAACPHCGYCPHCGHKPTPYPYNPWPYRYPIYPNYPYGQTTLPLVWNSTGSNTSTIN